jgi:hypothetical protein
VPVAGYGTPFAGAVFHFGNPLQYPVFVVANGNAIRSGGDFARIFQVVEYPLGLFHIPAAPVTFGAGAVVHFDHGFDILRVIFRSRSGVAIPYLSGGGFFEKSGVQAHLRAALMQTPHPRQKNVFRALR